MKLMVTIGLDNAAFWTEDGRLNEEEIALVLRRAASYAVVCRDYPMLRDSNGNVVGAVKVTGRKP